MLSIDPGLNGTGIVYWLDATPLRAAVLHPLNSVVRATIKNAETDLAVRARSLAQRVCTFPPRSGRAHSVVIEFPEHHESFKGRTARTTGSIDRLTFFIGVLVGTLPPHWRVILVRVRDWKGQLPKDVVTARMIKRYGPDMAATLRIRAHAWDALGIGSWAWDQDWMK